MEQKTTLDNATHALADTATAKTVAERLPLLVNVDLESLDGTGMKDDDHAGLQRLVVSVRADDVFRSPHDTLAKVSTARADGRVICLDGLGADDHAATLLALIEPDIILTSPDFLIRSTDLEMAQLAHALNAHIERSNAVVIAEGVDTAAAAQAARTLGASYGIGRCIRRWTPDSVARRTYCGAAREAGVEHPGDTRIEHALRHRRSTRHVRDAAPNDCWSR